MNTDQLKKRLGTHLRLRPLPTRVANDGRILPPVDDDWFLNEVRAKPKGVKLTNSATGHVLELEADNIKEYRSPHFLMLRCQLMISHRGIEVEPLQAASTVARIVRGSDGNYRFSVVVKGLPDDVRAFTAAARRRVTTGVISGAETTEWAQMSFACATRLSPDIIEALAAKHGVKISCAALTEAGQDDSGAT